jgi:hypothetical protein
MNDVAAAINKADCVLWECLQGEIEGQDRRARVERAVCCMKSKLLNWKHTGQAQKTYTYAL